jgi:hypothetical protein
MIIAMLLEKSLEVDPLSLYPLLKGMDKIEYHEKVWKYGGYTVVPASLIAVEFELPNAHILMAAWSVGSE